VYPIFHHIFFAGAANIRNIGQIKSSASSRRSQESELLDVIRKLQELTKDGDEDQQQRLERASLVLEANDRLQSSLLQVYIMIEFIRMY
jgi:hypothetical protein